MMCGQPVGLVDDHGEQALAVLLGDPFALHRHRRAVDGGERRAELVRDGRDEVRLERAQALLLGHVAERVHAPLLEADAGERQPQLASAELDRGGARRRLRDGRPGAHRHELLDLLPVRQHAIERQPGRGVLGDARDRRGGRVPVLDDAAAVDEHDALADVGERAGRAGTLLGRPVEAGGVDRRARTPAEVLGGGEIVVDERLGVLGAHERDRPTARRGRPPDGDVRAHAECAQLGEVLRARTDRLHHVAGHSRRERHLPRRRDRRRAALAVLYAEAGAERLPCGHPRGVAVVDQQPLDPAVAGEVDQHQSAKVSTASAATCCSVVW